MLASQAETSRSQELVAYTSSRLPLQSLAKHGVPVWWREAREARFPIKAYYKIEYMGPSARRMESMRAEERAL